MPDLTITYNDRTIVDLSDTGTRVLKTHGTFCKNDFVVQYNKPSEGDGEKLTFVKKIKIINNFTYDDAAPIFDTSYTTV